MKHWTKNLSRTATIAGFTRSLPSRRVIDLLLLLLLLHHSVLHACTLFFFNEIVPLPGQMIDWQGSQPHWKYNNGWRSGRGDGRKETLTDRQYASTNPLPTRPATVVALRSHPDDCVRSPSNEYFIYHVFLSFSP